MDSVYLILRKLMMLLFDLIIKIKRSLFQVETSPSVPILDSKAIIIFEKFYPLPVLETLILIGSMSSFGQPLPLPSQHSSTDKSSLTSLCQTRPRLTG